MNGKKLSRREMLRLAALGAVGTVASACAPQVVERTVEVEKIVEVERTVEVEVPVEVEVEVPVEAPEKEPVTLQGNVSFTQSDYGLQYEILQQWRDIFQQTYPWITVELAFVDWMEHQTITMVQAAAGEMPDFVEVHGQVSQLWIQEGMLLATDPYTDADPEFAVDDFFPEALALYQAGGKTFSFPYDHGPTLLGYNVDMFDEFGVDYPDETWTMDAFLEKAKIFTDEGKGTFGMTVWMDGHDLEGNFLMPWGGRLLNDDETECLITSPECIEALQFWADLLHVHKALPSPAQEDIFEALGGAFYSGKVAMYGSPPWDAPALNALADFKWDVAPWPEGSAGRFAGSMGSGYAASSQSEHPDEAWLWLRWMTSKEGLSFCWAAPGGTTPPRASIFDVYKNAPGVAPHAQYFYDCMDTYMVMGRPIKFNAWPFLDIGAREMDFMWLGEKTVEEMAEAIKKDGDPLLAEHATG
jgi:multiple sugar transport system substrate-binding protein